MRHAIDLPKAYRLLNHGPVTLVSSAHGNRRNVMAASWAMPLDFDPPKVLVVIDRNTFTRELIEASGEFALNIPPRLLASQVLAAGTTSGRDHDKFDACGLQSLPAERIAAPLVDACVAWLECRVIAEPRNQQRYDLFIGEVLAASADSRVFTNGRWRFSADGQEDDLRTLHYVAGGSFFQTGDVISVAADEDTGGD